MKAIPLMKAVMTPFPYWIGIDEPLARARAMMQERGIGHLPVVRGEDLVGVLTDRDAQRPAAAEPDERRVRDACATGPYVVGLFEPLDRVLFHMADQRLDSVLVAKDGRLAGIFTANDACREFGRLLRVLFPQGGDEAA